MTRLTVGDAGGGGADAHPGPAPASRGRDGGRGDSASWVKQLDRLTRPLPAELRAETDRILLQAAAAGASLEDLTLLANAAVEQYLAQQPSEEPGTGSTSGSCR